jgi:taurine dioxygenase
MKTLTSSAFAAERLDARFDWGVTVTGLTLGALDDALVRQELYALWIREGVIVFRGLDGVQEQLALSRVFGPLREHPSPENISAEARELIDVRFEPQGGQVNLVDGEYRGQSLPWHSDLIYVDKINHGGILRPLVLPSRSGETGFIDKITAYDALPDDVKTRVAELHVVYKYDLDLGAIRFGPDRGSKVIRFSEVAAKVQSRVHAFPRVIHPIVFEQPETGRKVLNVSPWFAEGIHELRTPEGDELLEFLAQHVTDARRAYYHRWRLGEMLLWDNWRMLHGTKGSPIDQARYLQRTTIGGDYGLGRPEPGIGREADGLTFLHV